MKHFIHDRFSLIGKHARMISSVSVFYIFLLFMEICPAQDSQYQIAFLCNASGNDDIFIVDANGNGYRNLTRSPISEGALSWSPDGSKLVYYTSDYLMHIINADGTNKKDITVGAGKFAFEPKWSPDGKNIAFICGFRTQGNDTTEIFTMSSDGSNQKRITYGNLADEACNLSWSPQGDKLAFVCGTNGSITNNRILVLTKNDTINGIPLLPWVYLRVLTSNHLNTPNYDWSPDGKWIVFESSNSTSTFDPFGLQIASVDSGTIYAGFKINGGKYPCWSPDGNTIIFEHPVDSIDNAGNHHIVGNGIFSFSNGKVSLLVRDTLSLMDPTFCPDGSMIAFVKENKEIDYDICVVNSDGSNYRIVAGTPYWQSMFKWSPLRIGTMAIQQKPPLELSKSIRTSYGISNGSVYDLLGRKLSNNPILSKDFMLSGGIYIHRLKSNSIRYKKAITSY